MPAVQMNTRIDSELKRQGDAVFAEFGYSPSEAVRLMWGFAARNQHNRKVMAELLDKMDDRKAKTLEEERQARVEAILAGPRLVQQYLQELGTDSAGLPSWTPEEMDEQIGLALEEDHRRILAGADEG